MPLKTWRSGPGTWVTIGISAILLASFAWDALVELEHIWSKKEEYSHGYFIPFLSLFLVWQQKNELARLPAGGSGVGVAVVLLGVLVFLAGYLSTLYVVVHYSLIILAAGLVLSLYGWPGMRLLWPAVVFLIFMIPLPPFLYNNLSQHLQLISSEIGVVVIRAFGISVHLEGNIIDLGAMKLQVVEACNGLRYLFPLMSFGFLAALFFNAPVWQRVLVFLSTIPITVFMNSFRIGVTGWLVENYGTEHAEGFLHDFEGWFIFMACVGILLGEMWVLNRFFTRERRPFREVFGIEFPERLPKDLPREVRPVPKPFLASVGLLAVAAVASFALGQRVESAPARQEFVDFPTVLGEWKGRRDALDLQVLDALDVSDYILTDFANAAGEPVNFYVAWYDYQRAGETAHSPRACIPGGGWEIAELTRVVVDGVTVAGQPLEVNRVEIAKGEFRQVVYYWFQQRGRVMTSEYAMKGYLFWDALTQNRTDGALVRLTTQLRPGEDPARADVRLAAFARELEPVLERYVPN